ncbi:MAG: hypothetical protein R3F59_21705 [Myxococcota bacterium]
MQVEFRRTGERRYGVFVHRGGEVLAMDPAPGFDPHIPHDLVHFVAERELGIARGLFGQLAAGGDAGTFHLVRDGADPRTERRRRRGRAAGAARWRAATGATPTVEQAAQLCLAAWHARPFDPGEAFPAEAIRRAAAALDAVAARWAALAVGEGSC